MRGIKHKLVELCLDPGSNTLSMSRTCLGIMVLVTLSWVISCITGIVHKDYVQYVSTMLSAIVAAICTVYGVNSAATAWKRCQKCEGEQKNAD